MGTLGDAVARKEPFAAGLTITEGLLMKITANRCTHTTTVTDKPYAVTLEDYKDSEGTAVTTTAGDRLAVALIGSGEMVMMKSMASVSYTKGCAVYVSQTADTDGYCDSDSSNSATKVGHYAGAGETTSTAGQKILVLLDVANAN